MLVDIPAAQHKTMFFIVSLNVHVFIDSLSRAARFDNRVTAIVCESSQRNPLFLKPVTTVTVRGKAGRKEEEAFRPGQHPC